MRTKTHRPLVVGVSDVTRAREVQQEIEDFLRALNSYPDKFAHDPQLSFEQHLLSIAGLAQAYSGGENQRQAS
jgi:hypothetical protein